MQPNLQGLGLSFEHSCSQLRETPRLALEKMGGILARRKICLSEMSCNPEMLARPVVTVVSRQISM